MSEQNPPPVPSPAPPPQDAAPEPVVVPSPVPEPALVPEAAPVGEPAPVPSRRKVALGAAGALVAVAACGGIGYAVLHHGSGSGHTARATATTPWTQPAPTVTKAFGARSGGSHYGSLRLLLLPVPDDYGPGPDVEAYGNDVVLDAKRATALVRSEQYDTAKLSAKQRKNVEAYIADLHIEGAGLRTYTNHDSELVVRIEIVQLRNQRVAHAETKLFGEIVHAMGGFRNGPKIAGHPQAVCILPPKDAAEKLDGMLCQATSGDLMVKMRVEGFAPLDKASAADLLRRQLDRIQDPGESV